MTRLNESQYTHSNLKKPLFIEFIASLFIVFLKSWFSYISFFVSLCLDMMMIMTTMK